jgi:hypothetical protein
MVKEKLTFFDHFYLKDLFEYSKPFSPDDVVPPLVRPLQKQCLLMVKPPS